jgi:hypothetical protein
LKGRGRGKERRESGEGMCWGRGVSDCQEKIIYLVMKRSHIFFKSV